MKSVVRATAILCLLLPSNLKAETMSQVWSVNSLSNPESAYWDPESDQIVVSQMKDFGPNGGSDGKLSLLNASGGMINANWITGLVDPKGMATHDGLLFVADAPGLQVIDIASGTLVRTMALPGAILLNDVAITEDGTVLVTDLGANSVFRIKDGKVNYLIPPGAISLPNGIVAQGDRVVVGSFGEGPLSQAFTVEIPGGLFDVDPNTGNKAEIRATHRQASVDGIATLREWVVLADNPTGRLLGLKDGALTVLTQASPGIADIGATKDLILVPNSIAGTITAYKMP